MSLAYCDCCGAPMICVHHHRAEVCALGDTDACILCSGAVELRYSDEITEEIVELGPYMDEPKVRDRIIALGDVLTAKAAR